MSAAIKSIDTYIFMSGDREYLLTRLVTEDGVTGAGEATLRDGNAAVKRLIDERIAPFLIGKDVSCSNALFHEFMKNNDDMVLRHAISGAEIAAWDAYGKTVCLPVYKILGGKALPLVPLSLEYDAMDANPYADAASVARLTLPALDAPGPDRIREYKRARPEIIINRAGISAGADVPASSNPGALAGAIDFTRAAAAFDPVYVTGLLPIGDEAGWEALRDRGRGAMAAKASTRADAFPYITKACMSVIEADILDACGILELRRLAALAHTYYVHIAGYTVGGEVAALAAYHSLLSCANTVAASLPAAGYSELIPGGCDFAPTDKPGLGIEIDFSLL